MKHEIIHKEDLNPKDYLIEVRAPMVAKKIQPGQFVVLMTHPKGERIPMSVQKAENDSITMFIRKLGKTSVELYNYKVRARKASVRCYPNCHNYHHNYYLRP
jgi:ferredoxin--NADP+ reductase